MLAQPGWRSWAVGIAVFALVTALRCTSTERPSTQAEPPAGAAGASKAPVEGPSAAQSLSHLPQPASPGDCRNLEGFCLFGRAIEAWNVEGKAEDFPEGVTWFLGATQAMPTQGEIAPSGLAQPTLSALLVRRDERGTFGEVSPIRPENAQEEKALADVLRQVQDVLTGKGREVVVPKDMADAITQSARVFEVQAERRGSGWLLPGAAHRAIAKKTALGWITGGFPGEEVGREGGPRVALVTVFTDKIAVEQGKPSADVSCTRPPKSG